MSDHPDSGYHSDGSFGDEGRNNKRAPYFEGGSENVIFPQIPNHFSTDATARPIYGSHNLGNPAVDQDYRTASDTQ